MMISPIVLALSLFAPVWSIPSAYPAVDMHGVSGNVRMPLVGLGSANYNNTSVQTVIKDAFSVGFRAVDTALVYGNQIGVGMALQNSGLPREEYFVTSKIMGGMTRAQTLAALDTCLRQLNMSYVDLMLIHFPADMRKRGSPSLRKEQWLAMESWAKEGKAKAIGVSHFCRKHVEDILEVSSLPIALNQVMYHVGMGTSPPAATDDKEYMVEQEIVYMSFSTLCGPCGANESKELITGPLVTEIGKQHNVSGAQVALRWAVQQGIPVIPRSASRKHLAENFDLFSFNLSPSEMARLNAATTPSFGASASGDCDVGLEELDAVMSMSQVGNEGLHVIAV
mmetsp:Transcript_25321/g.58841  ORF Transcript_25321/g.58841 Transcript_25321/m.58841 type:complete len:338 (-) Transcript_25321:226-1239(-)|eukprot:CAMPEP_0178405822 /NCGR_PEP_ID=MMETSP0689_2-20121128/18596_1 /TAXON_ID=160604 /ORGANISM="Amphidinium massartii, Strain CS-259" /LENGTH=337 /DNA_ID=CAMNT_0020026847 /DNA_START=41 /DNA_END=1054 /DNA_ORIENTATION=-